MVACCFGAANAVSRPGGGMVSDAMGRRFGMRGRLWSLWAVQTLGGLLGVLLGRVGTLEASMAVMFLLAVFVQAAAGLAFGVVPFVSKRYVILLPSVFTQQGLTTGIVCFNSWSQRF